MLENKVVVKVIGNPKNWLDIAVEKTGVNLAKVNWIHHSSVEPKFTNMNEYWSTLREYTVEFGIKLD